MNVGVSANDDRFNHEFCFKALAEPSHPDAVPFSIGSAGKIICNFFIFSTNMHNQNSVISKREHGECLPRMFKNRLYGYECMCLF